MKSKFGLLVLIFLILSCSENTQLNSVNPANWSTRSVESVFPDSLIHGTTYLSVYSQIYSQTEHRTHNLTVTVSMRNVNKSDTIYIDKAEYFDTRGNSIRTYFDQAIFIAPMETVEIVIEEKDKAGGTGGNLLFDWKVEPQVIDPLFEAVMISTSGQQGLSFSTQGKKIK